MEDPANIVCPTSTWFFKRIAMVMALTGGLSAFFLYDGLIGYPKKNHLADLFDVFKNSGTAVPQTRNPTPKQLKELARAKEAALNGGTWVGFAAGMDLPEKEPKRYSPEEISHQFLFSLITGTLTLGIGIYALLSKRRSLQASRDALRLPSGKSIPYASIRTIDLRKWDRGIGVITYDGADGSEMSARIDDYVYAGAAKVLDRIRTIQPDVIIEGDSRWLDQGKGA